MSIVALEWYGNNDHISTNDIGDGTKLHVFRLVEPDEYQLVQMGTIRNPIDENVLGTFGTQDEAKMAGHDWTGDTVERDELPANIPQTFPEKLDAATSGEEFGQLLLGLFNTKEK
jgi:hypothetical protein